MKYCPHCGAVLPDGTFSFCPACGKALPESDAPAAAKKRSGKGKKPPNAKKSKPAKSPASVQPDDGYDGYYDDRIPIDAGKRREEMDTGIIKKVIAVVVCLLVVIGACVALLYIL